MLSHQNVPCARLIKQAAGLLRTRFIPHDTRWQAARRGLQLVGLDRFLYIYLLYAYKPRLLPRQQRAQAHNSTPNSRQKIFMQWLCTKQKGLLCAYEHDFGDNYIITIVSTGLTTKKYVIVLSVLNLVSDFVKCNRPIGEKTHNKTNQNAIALFFVELGNLNVFISL